jgi:antitoxin component YwqK of YwqJK toxin-antitoxin module
MQKIGVYLTLFLLFTANAMVFGQKNTSKQNPKTELPPVVAPENGTTIIPKTPKPIRTRFDKLTVNNNGLVYKDNQLFTGDFYMVFNPNEKPTAEKKFVKYITSREGHFTNGLKDGAYYEYSKEGIKQVYETYVLGKKNGPFTYYFENGAIEIEGNFSNGELDGKIVGYFANGNKNYINLYSIGNRNGTCSTFFQDGTLEQEATFVNEIPDGDMIGYFPNGKVRNIKTFNMGILEGRNYVFHKNGCPAIEEYYKHGKLDSIQRAFDYLSCNIINTGYWKEGKKNGVFVSYEMFGDTLEFKTYKDDKRNGLIKVFKENWNPEIKKMELKLESMGMFENESPNGFWFYGRISNQDRRDGKYDLGVKVGEWNYYNKEGALFYKQWYDNEGNLLKDKALN